MDISAFAVASADPVKLDQVGKAIGGPWGSTNVDNQFEGYLKVRVSRYFVRGGSCLPERCRLGTSRRSQNYLPKALVQKKVHVRSCVFPSSFPMPTLIPNFLAMRPPSPPGFHTFCRSRRQQQESEKLLREQHHVQDYPGTYGRTIGG